MANNYWYYPQASGATNTLEFAVKGGHLLEGSDIGLEPNEETALSKGGTRFVESFGADKETYQFSAIIYKEHASYIDYADVRAFRDAIRGAFFVWSDESAVQRTVKMIGGLNFVAVSHEYLKFGTVLEVQ